MDGLKRKTLLKWMIGGYHYFRKHPNRRWSSTQFSRGLYKSNYQGFTPPLEGWDGDNQYRQIWLDPGDISSRQRLSADCRILEQRVTTFLQEKRNDAIWTWQRSSMKWKWKMLKNMFFPNIHLLCFHVSFGGFTKLCGWAFRVCFLVVFPSGLNVETCKFGPSSRLRSGF